MFIDSVRAGAVVEQLSLSSLVAVLREPLVRAKAPKTDDLIVRAEDEASAHP
jgi:hypothetical protein